ncbi:MAG TPA: efflux RND transporter periplasmic adaptor subunit [Marinagarivorans sp.]
MSFGKRMLPVGFFLAGCAALSIVVFAKPKPEPRPISESDALVSVSVIEATPKSARLAVAAQGTVVPRREIDIIAQVSGLVVGVNDSFVDGGFFVDGQRLLQLDKSDYEVAALSAQSRLADARRLLAEEQGMSRQAQREWRDLGNQNANDLFIRKPQLAAREAAVAHAEAELKKAQLDLARTDIVAPYAAGRIKQTLVDLGQYVAAGTRLATVYDSSVIEVRVPLTEPQAALVDLPLLPLPAGAKANAPRVDVSGVVAGRLEHWQGRLTRTGAFVDPDTRMFNAVIEVDSPFAGGAPLLPGLFVDVTIEGKALEQVLELPRNALFERDKVYVLDEANKISQRQVQVLRKTEDAVWLRADIPAGVRVALEKQTLTPVGSEVAPSLVGKTAKADDAKAPAETSAMVSP